MATTSQILTDRTASRRATGPRTPEGKQISSRNSLRHGLASGAILIPGEDPALLNALEDALFEEHQPANPTEALLVEDMVKHHWLKDRALRLQGEALATAAPGELPASFALLLRYQTANDRAFHKALATLTALKKEQLAQEREFVSQQEEQEDLEMRRHIMQSLTMPPLPSHLERFRRPKETARSQPSTENLVTNP